MIDRDPDDPVFLLKLLPKCIILWLHIHWMHQEIFPTTWMYRKPQFSKFFALFCGCFFIDSSSSRCWNLETINSTSTLLFCSSSDMMKIADGHCGYYEWMRNISLHWKRNVQELHSMGRRKSSLCGISAFMQQILDYVVWRHRDIHSYFFEDASFNGMQTCSIISARL